MKDSDRQRPECGRRFQHVAALLLVMAMAGCASPRTRIETKLVEAGLPRPQAACVADRMASQLSLGQLQKISDAVAPARYGKLTIGELTERLMRVNDPEIIRVLTNAGINCVVLG